MIELFFPVVGTLLVFLVAVPALTLVSCVALRFLPQAASSIDGHGNPVRYALTVAPVAVPVLWLVSASVHQLENGAPIAACVVDHLGTEICRDVVLFGFLLLGVLGWGVARRLGLGRTADAQRVTMFRASDWRVRRVQDLCRTHAVLSRHATRVHVVAQGRAPVCTRGLLRPRMELEAAVVEQLTDEELAAVLLHELEHARAGDPLRSLIAQVSLSLNPLGHLLSAEYARYCFAREALCDRRAVQLGADPLALARSIVAVAGNRPRPALVAGLCGDGMSGIRLRVQLLFDYAARWPGPARRHAPFGLLTTATASLLLLPHFMGTGPLDLLHLGVESAALLLGLG
ncbi:MAG TPA: M56 family metallopeptidase [Haliangium sp.]|nr:M56 family metallopeptidase [Haliangium sp.]